MNAVPSPPTATWSALVLAVAAGCAGARVTVTAERATYPIPCPIASATTAAAFYERRELQTIGKLQTDATRLGFLYLALTPRSTIDISDAVNAQVAAAEGGRPSWGWTSRSRKPAAF